jgi:hypothetical protein
MPQLGGAIGVVLVLWYVFWRIGLVREWMRRAGIGRRHQVKHWRLQRFYHHTFSRNPFGSVPGQSRSSCTNGHRLSPKEQNTQQSPAFGRKTAPHAGQS